jgi:ribosomal protein L11 methylase PrmA
MPEPEQQWDVIAVNIYGPILVQAAYALSLAIKPKGDIILSGILSVQWPEVRAAFEEEGFTFEDVQTRGKWITRRGRR